MSIMIATSIVAGNLLADSTRVDDDTLAGRLHRDRSGNFVYVDADGSRRHVLADSPRGPATTFAVTTFVDGRETSATFAIDRVLPRRGFAKLVAGDDEALRIDVENDLWHAMQKIRLLGIRKLAPTDEELDAQLSALLGRIKELDESDRLAEQEGATE